MKLKKLYKIFVIATFPAFVIATFPALGFLLLLKMFEKTVRPNKLKGDEDWLCAAAAYQLTSSVAAAWIFVAVSAD